LETGSFDQSLAVVAIAEIAKCGLPLFKVLEMPHPKKLLLESAEEAFNAAVGLGCRLQRIATAQDRLVKGMRVAGVRTLEQANDYLLNDYLAWWERELTVEAASNDDAHRALGKSHHLAASLRHVETRQARPDYTLRWDGKLYQIERAAIVPGLRKANVRVEARLDGTLAVRHRERYLPVKECATADKPSFQAAQKPAPKQRGPRARSTWMDNFHLKKRKPASEPESPAAAGLRRTGTR
jgi:hypothetical protein